MVFMPWCFGCSSPGLAKSLKKIRKSETTTKKVDCNVKNMLLVIKIRIISLRGLNNTPGLGLR